MNANELLRVLSDANAELEVSGDKLFVDCGEHSLTNAHMEALKVHKAVIKDIIVNEIGEGTVLPLSHRQRDMWTVWKLNPASAAYNIAFSAKLQPGVDQVRLCKAFSILLMRHRILLSRFVELAGLPFQAFDKGLAPQVVSHSANNLTAEQVNELLEMESDRAFDLKRCAPIRASTLENTFPDTGVAEAFLTLTVHHIAADFVSLGILTRDLSHIYFGLEQGALEAPEPNNAQYVDFVRWEGEQLHARGEALAEYWIQRIPESLPTLEMPSDRPRPVVSSGAGECHSVPIDPETWQRFSALSKKCGVTPYIATLALIEILLYRYTGQKDLLIGSPVSNRDMMAAQEAIGDFVNPVVFTSDIEPGEHFEVLLTKVRDTVLGALENRIYPFSSLVQAANPPRVAGASPLFQVSYIWHQGSFEGLAEENAPTDNALYSQVMDSSRVRGSANDISFIIVQMNEDVQLRLTYSTDLFDRPTMSLLARHFLTLMKNVIEQPRQAIGQLSMLADEERALQLEQFNQTQVAYPGQRLIHHYFEQEAGNNPNALAVIAGADKLTYHELNEQANRLAHQLILLGAAADKPIAICVERSTSMMIGLLAILKAGAPYLPLETSYPQQRLDYMLEHAAPQLLVSESKQAARFTDYQGLTVLLDRPGDWADQPCSNPGRAIGSEQLAYCIYTSGSTGEPKGVMNTHGAILNRLQWMQATYPIGSNDRVLQKTSFCFDVSVWELFWPLMTGAAVVMADPVAYRDPVYLRDLVESAGITVLHFVPAMLQGIMDAGLEWEGARLRYVFCSGEALKSATMHKALRLWPDCTLHNLYGPTEAAVDVTYWQCVPSQEHTGVPIGMPIANTRIYILDAEMNLLPIGAKGEIHIGGSGLARGYLKRPDLTAERFVPDPFDPQGGGRLYRTGDLGHYLPDGNIQYIGRVDHQVKIRGFRIELGEIEAVLSGLDDVSDVAVLLHEEADGDKKLLAFAVALTGRELNADRLREAASKKLPEYMVPGMFVFLDAMPITANGKIDRKQLPIPQDLRVNRRDSYIEPSGEVEVALALFLAELLKLDRVGAQDSFFDLGGHSLLAIQLLSKIRETMGLDISLLDFFNAPTVAGLARKIAKVQTPARELPPMMAVPRGELLPLSFAQERLWFLSQLEPESGAYNVPVTLRITGPLDTRVMERALNALVARHEILRTRFVTREGKPLQHIELPACVSLSITRLDHLPEQERERSALALCREQAALPFTLTDARLIRAHLYQLSARVFIFNVTLHHIITDGWSLGVMVQELGVLYRAFCNDTEAELAATELHYADYASWQREWLLGGELDHQLQYWRESLANAPTALNLPTSFPRPAKQGYRGAVHAHVLDAQLIDSLNRLSQAQGATLFMTLMSAFSVLLARYSGQNDLCVGYPIANRSGESLSGMLGLFVNSLVLRTQLDPQQRFTELLSLTRQKTLEGYMHQDVPFEKLVDALQPSRALTRSPLFQVMFALQNVSQQMPDIAGLSFDKIDLDIGIAKLDLNVTASESSLGLEMGFEYNTDLFDADHIARMAMHFEQLLRVVVAAPETRIGGIQFLGRQEQVRQRECWNSTAVAYDDRAESAVALFEQHAIRTPKAIAIELDNGQQVSYEVLNAKAQEIADFLHCAGVEKGAIVGLSVERSFLLIAGVLGIMKAGAVLLPLDPGYPVARTRYALTHARAAMVLTQKHLVAELPETPARQVCLDEPWPCAVQGQVETAVQPADLAYVIYTSGSTGNPKGVMVTQEGLTNLLLAMKEKTGLDHQGVVLGLTSFSFDIAYLEMLLPLVCGARLIQPSSSRVADFQALAKLLNRSDLTLVQGTPATWRMLLEQKAWQRQASSFSILCGGEALHASLADELLSAGIRVYNMYGPTETTIWSSMYQLTSDETLQTVPIGYPLANTAIYITDAEMNLLPTGAIGEIYIGGVGLARGYLHRPDLTAERFVPDPFSTRGGERLYKTGDLGFLSEEGCLNFVGRSDHQVKVRGFRIELGEIESVLNGAPGVSEAVVQVHTQEEGDARLIAYVVVEVQAQVKTAFLRQYLGQRLPDYMLPGLYVYLDSLPLTPNGKVNRLALAALEHQVQSVEETRAVPNTQTEKRLAGIWSHVLKRDASSLSENFFESGGHSLLAAQMISKIREDFEIELPLLALFDNPTLGALARAIDEQDQVTSGDVPLLVSDLSRLEEPFALTSVQQAYWVGRRESMVMGNIATHVYSEITFPELDVSRLSTAWNRAIQRHPALRSIFLTNGTQQILRDPGSYEIVYQDLSAAAPQESARQSETLRAAMSHQVFEPHVWPLFELKVLRNAQEFRLFASIDALIMDAWSYQILLADVVASYQDLQAEPEPLSLSFRDYVSWTEKVRETSGFSNAKRYWLDRLATLPAAPNLPLLKRPEEVRKPQFERRDRFLSAAQWQGLQKRGQQLNVTPTVVLLTAFTQVLSRWSGDETFALNLTLFNRPPLHPQINQLVGDFTSTTLLEVGGMADAFGTRAVAMQRQLWADLEHVAFSGLDVIRALAQRSSDGKPGLMPVVFTSAIGFGSAQEGELDADGLLAKLGADVDYQISQTPQVWLDHTVREAQGRLYLCWDAVEELFPDGMLDAMFEVYLELLEKLASDESAWRVPFGNTLPAGQRATREQFNATSVPRQAATLSGLFVDSVARRPHAVALIAPDRTFTYEELYQAAASIAQQLMRITQGRNELIAVGLEKGWEQAVACLGILLAGAAYVPIDPDLPQQRQSALFVQSGVRLVIVGALPMASATVNGEPQFLSLYALLEASSVQVPLIEPKQDDLAYVIFTSGSTGTPKGVAIDHQGACNTLVDLNKRFGVDEHDRVFGLSSLSFDLSVFDIFGTLAAGATLVIPGKKATHNPSEWCRLIVEHGVTIWNSVPALMGLLIDYVHDRKLDIFAKLRLVMLSGDWIPLPLVAQVHNALPCAELISLGGATEVSIWSVFYPVETVPDGWLSVPYGGPLENQCCYILDEKGNDCPDWVTGELYIGGRGVAKAYWGDAVKTANSFIPHPNTGERIYKTGDLARFRPEGLIEFIGRKDTQVKLHGNRIELGEIDAAVAPSLASQCITCLEKRAGKVDALVSYVVAPKEASGMGGEGAASELKARIRKHLFATLPSYMVPKEIVLIDQLPLTGNGKVDRQMLARKYDSVLASATVVSDDNAPASVSSTARDIAQMVAGILALDSVEPEENLLEKGMTSLEFIRVFNLIEERYQVRPDIAELYREPRVSTLVRSIEKHQGVVSQTVSSSDELLVLPEQRAAFKRSRKYLREQGITGEKTSFQYGTGFTEATHIQRLMQRKTANEFADRPVGFDEFISLLNMLSFVEQGGALRALYPSAGGLYPVQVYVQIERGRVAGFEEGAYYFHPINKQLVRLSQSTPITAQNHYPANQLMAAATSFTLFLVADLSAISPLYGDAGRDMNLIEAGAMLQLLMTDCQNYGINLRPIGGVVFDGARDALQLSSRHLLLHTILAGASPQAAHQLSDPESSGYIHLSI
ncbi:MULTISPECIES: non-ribosomal peptide synthetase [Gammaproteobacteria]|uniref:non-ribosomal peptide synthetase n=1 Tax=Gammaproteobacteria TaxID=1236 RepID=UPI00191225D9|nr:MULTISPECIES: non-ribosomal peptide synthetase [Gammaproteobacteria]MBK5304161.1 amino acid adenylation domain-containing protein [Bacillus sp. TH86]MBK5323930.1 amino acid adenylation domain-containing protein [Bacillus sp. TH59]MBK5338880.1 amino acid adenylation domain-containing protein [Bacillus sp. TH57]MBK5312931.1 amino acid adenylation domain-containing protein [Pseudomonas sp. TH71]MBK5318428.1 amino acid adenylation domain-containing protein [Erwinia sp. TH79]